ncbi:MAG TPA: outer membrane beta-barrel protein [Roseimicrobium sp.]|nr:outer membrane beta-barrel protein [Roseimicrobium sp.]
MQTTPHPTTHLKKNSLLVGATALMLAAVSAFGSEQVAADSGSYYQANELSVDGFGSASVGKDTINNWSGSRVKHDARLGAGAGINYFFTRNIGIGGDALLENTSGPFIDSASVSLILRFPLGSTGFAPYALGGGGRQFDIDHALSCHFGGGIEYRFAPKVGAFVDARCVVPEKTSYYGTARLGLRFSF